MYGLLNPPFPHEKTSKTFTFQIVGIVTAYKKKNSANISGSLK